MTTPTTQAAARRLWPLLLAALLLLAVAVSPAVRTQLRESFTRLPTDYTELYFAADPTLAGSGAGAAVRIPVTLVHHGAAVEAFTVRATVTAPGETAAAQNAVSGRPETAEPTVLTVRLAAPAASYLVEVTLPGHPQSLSFRLDPEGRS